MRGLGPAQITLPDYINLQFFKPVVSWNKVCHFGATKLLKIACQKYCPEQPLAVFLNLRSVKEKLKRTSLLC